MVRDAGSGMFPIAPITHTNIEHTKPIKYRCRRLQQRITRAAAITDTTNRIITSLNHLSYSLPSVANTPTILTAASLSPASVPMNAAKNRLVDHCFNSARRYHSRTSSVMDDDSSSDNQHTEMNHQSSTIGYSKSTTAVPLIASSVSLPEAAGAVDMMSSLPAHIMNYYRDGSRCLRKDPSTLPTDTTPLSKPRFFGARSEQIALYKRMERAGMLVYTTDQPTVINGLFGVPKGDKQRLIIDGRYANRIFEDAPHVSLPSPELLSQLIIPHHGDDVTVIGHQVPPVDVSDHDESIRADHHKSSHRPLYVAKCDLSDFFYRFRIPEWMQTYFGLPPLTSDELGLVDRYGSGVRVWPQLTVLAMGWSHSVFITQSIHEHLLDTATGLCAADRINHTNDLRVDRTRHMVYIDDLIIIGFDRADVERLQQQYVDTVNERQLPVKPSKVVAPSADGVDCLGVEVNGTDYTVGVRPIKLQRLINDTHRIIKHGECSGRYLAQLIGRWTWSMMVKRPALSIFNAVYRYIEVADRRTFTLWPTVITELQCVIGIAPLLWSSIASKWCPKVMVSDASMGGMGVCTTVINNEPLLDRLAYCRGTELSQLQSIVPSSATEQCPAPTGDTTQQSLESYRDDCMNNLARDNVLVVGDVDVKWQVVVATPWRAIEHINSYELRSSSTALRWLLSHPGVTGKRVMLLSDSQVAVGCMSKGRSSSHVLLRRMRNIASHVMASGIHVYCRWIPSELNPADEPSRRFPPL